MYLLVVLAGTILLMVPADTLEMEELEKRIAAGVCIVLGLPFAVASVLPFFFAPRPWLWVYGIVLIAIGFTSCCFWPICIPLLISWIKPDVQRFFGKDV
jgi:MFS family permease